MLALCLIKPKYNSENTKHFSKTKAFGKAGYMLVIFPFITNKIIVFVLICPKRS